MAGSKSRPNPTGNKSHRPEDEGKRVSGVPVPRAPKVAKMIVNPRGQRKGR